VAARRRAAHNGRLAVIRAGCSQQFAEKEATLRFSAACLGDPGSNRTEGTRVLTTACCRDPS